MEMSTSALAGAAIGAAAAGAIASALGASMPIVVLGVFGCAVQFCYTAKEEP